MSNPKFSIILPTHNGAERISLPVMSIMNQTFKDWELIIVLDACEDDTKKAVENLFIDDLYQLDKIRFIEVDCHRDGLARNAGLDAATGEWILFIDDDDYFLHEYCFELLAEQVGKHNEDVLDFSFIWKGRGYKTPSKDECFVMVWCRAWRREFIGDNRFDGEPYASDKRFFQKMIQNNLYVNVYFWNVPIYYYNYMREGSLSWMEKQKTLIDIIVTHYDEPWELGKPLFDMIEMQECADLSDISVTVVQDGAATALPFDELLSGYSYKVNVITLDKHSGVAEARNAGIEATHSDWIMFCNFDDSFADRCSLSVILKNFPTDDYDIIWGKLVEETMWYTGITYLNRWDGVNFTHTCNKFYRRKFLDDKHIRFDSKYGKYYDFAFNQIVMAEMDEWRVASMQSEFYPYLKTYRPESTRHTPKAFTEMKNFMFDRDCMIAEDLALRNHKFKSERITAKAIIGKYYEYDEVGDETHNQKFSNKFLSYYVDHRDILMRMVNSSEIDVIKEEIETEVFSVIQQDYNEHKKENYLLNDGVSLEMWLNYLDSITGVASSQSQEEPDIVVSADNPDTTISGTENETVPDRNARVVVYCGTYNVYMNMVASCKSLLCNTPVDKVYFLIEDDEFPYELPDIVTCINVKDQQYFPSDGPNFNNAWTYMCMIRAAFPEMFPQYDRILSLDIDIVINDNVSDLWDYDISDYYLAGVPERQRQKSSADPLYINFGVVMMNLDKLRRDGIQQQVIDGLNTKRFGCPEQDAFNRYCAGHILDLPAEFNYTTYSHITGDAIKERIIHYAGQKFWRHYKLVKQYSDLDWTEVMSRQNALKGVR